MRSLILASTLLCQVLHSQVIQPQPQLLPGTGGTWNVQWLGIQGRSYFLQASDDLVSWHYAPLIEAGNDEIIEYETGALGSRHFLRLAYVNQTASNLDTADFDDDDLGNLAEINVHHTDPLKQDTDEDGMPDGWEINHGLDPNDNGSISFVNGPSGDKDGDGIPNIQEFQGGTDPVSAGSYPVSLLFIEKTASQNFSTPSGTLSRWPSWLPGESASDTISAFSSPQAMSGQLESAYVFPALPPPKATISPVGGTVGVVSASYGSTQSGGGRTVHGHVQHGRFWLKASPSDVARGKGSQKFLKVIDRYTGPYTGGLGRLDPLVSVEKLEAQASTGFSVPLDIMPEVVTGSGNFFSSTVVSLTPVNIQPVEGMAGVVGDMVPSNRTTNPEFHFVTPKKTGEIAEDYVTFTATGVTEQQITNGHNEQIVEWDGGQPVLNEPLKRRVSRSVAEKTPIKIQTLQKFGGQEVAKLNVWVVSCTISESYPELRISSEEISEPVPAFKIKASGHFQGVISPIQIITDQDRPALDGEKKVALAGVDTCGGLLNSGASNKWDISRRVRKKCAGIPGSIVTCVDEDEDYPVSPVQGNDDASTVDERNDPYSIASHKIDSDDYPQRWLGHQFGNDGEVASYKLHFQEFARLEIGGQWYRISDYFLWRAHLNFRKADGKWMNNGSVAEPNNNDF